jgi:hypothetical protein
MLLLSADVNSKPCSQKIIFCKVRIDRELHNERLKEILNFNIEGNIFGQVKISQTEDEKVYNFIETLIL